MCCPGAEELKVARGWAQVAAESRAGAVMGRTVGTEPRRNLSMQTSQEEI